MTSKIEFKELLDKSIIRQEELLKILTEEKKWNLLAHLAKQLKWDIKTIRKDIIYINDTLPKGWEIITSKGLGIKLEKPINSSITDVMFLIRKKTSIYKIFQCILLDNNQYSLTELSKKTHYSYKHTKNILNTMNDHLIRFGLELHFKPLKMRGPEFLIRTYLVRFYMSIYDQKWPFEQHIQNSINRYLSNFEQNLDIPLLSREKYQLSLHLYVTIQRIKKRRFVDDSIEKYKSLKNNMFYNAFLKVIPLLEKEQNIKMPTREIFAFVSHLIGAKYLHGKENRVKQIISKRIREGKGYAYSKCNLFLSALEKELDMALLDDDDILYHLSYYFRRMLHITRLHSLNILLEEPVEIITSTTFIDKIKNKFPSTFDIVRKHYISLFNNFLILDEDIAIITLLIESNKLRNDIKPVKILLYMVEQPTLYFYLRSFLLKNYQGKVEIIKISTKNTNKFLKYTECKLVITDTNLPLNPNIITVKVSDFLTKRDEEIIQQKITSLFNL
ncbi:TPA: PRD domain-containing protein [Bacillus cereus]